MSGQDVRCENIAIVPNEGHDPALSDNEAGTLHEQIDGLRRELAAERALAARHKRMLNSASRLAKLGSWELDLATMDYVWSDGMFDLHEVDSSFDYRDPVNNVDRFYFPADRARVHNAVQAFRQDNRPFAVEARMRTAQGNERWSRLTGEVEYEDGLLVRRFGVKQDITAEKTMLDRVARLARLDDLTGLSKRSVLIEHLTSLIGAADIARRRVALFFIDLDGFKAVNDSRGHEAGDTCLIRIARRLRSLPIGRKLVARIGGDEFAIAVDGLDNASEQTRIAKVILHEISRNIRWRGETLSVGASVGVASTLGEALDPEALMREADLAMYAAKAAGRNRAVSYTSDLDAETDARKQLAAEAFRDLASNRFCLHYQPKINLHDSSLTGFEALLRWDHDDGIRTPGSFRAVLDHPDLSMRLGKFVLNEALDQARAWLDAGFQFGHISINIGAGQIADPTLPQSILLGIARRQLPPSAIVIEVTEDVFLTRDPGPVHALCEAMKNHGISVSLDDFGTGFASLTHLRTLPVDELKIDRSFVSRLGQDHVTTAIVKAIAGLARDLGHKIVAEGVETQNQAQILRELACDHAQGYLFGRPLPAGAAQKAASHGWEKEWLKRA
jgi:diguanylate cyclase (GGDEF)-like protein